MSTVGWQGEQGMVIKAWDVYGLVDKENNVWWSRHEMSTAWLTRRTRHDNQGMRCLRVGWQGEQGMMIKAWDVYGLVDKENKAWWSRHEMSTAWLTRRTRHDDQGMRCRWPMYYLDIGTQDELITQTLKCLYKQKFNTENAHPGN